MAAGKDVTEAITTRLIQERYPEGYQPTGPEGVIILTFFRTQCRVQEHNATIIMEGKKDTVPLGI